MFLKKHVHVSKILLQGLTLENLNSSLIMRAGNVTIGLHDLCGQTGAGLDPDSQKRPSITALWLGLLMENTLLLLFSGELDELLQQSAMQQKMIIICSTQPFPQDFP